MRTMLRALEMCVPLFVLMVAVFTWPGIVLEPGIPQLWSAVAVLTVTIGMTASIHGRFAGSRRGSLDSRIGLAVLSIVLLAQPPVPVAAAVAAVIIGLTGYGWVQARRQRQATETSPSAPPTDPLEPERR